MTWKAYDSHPKDSRVAELKDGVCTTCVSNWSKRGASGVLVMKVYERHDQDSRYRDMGSVCETVSAKYGTGGGNQPLVSYGLHPFIDNANTATKHAGPDGDGFKKEQAFTLASMGVPKVAKCIAMCECGTDRAITEDATPPLKVASKTVIAVSGNIIGREPQNGGHQIGVSDDGKSYTLTSTDRHAVALGGRHEVRRLMPIECERLQGMPDNWTRIPYRGKPAEDCPDSPRYKAIGNSWAVPVIHWIGKRIDAAVKAAEPEEDWI